MNKTLALLAGAAALVFLAGTAWFAFRPATGSDRFAQCRGAAVAGDSLGGPFELVNGDGRTVTDEDVITEPALLYFGYTYCPDVCPLDVGRNAMAVDVLEERGQSVTPVFISIDPARDTPEVVKEYADVMHPRMVGLTGSAEQVKAASAAYRTYYKAHEDQGDDYLVDHSTFTYLVLPETGFVDFFRREVTPEEMADRVECYINAM